MNYELAKELREAGFRFSRELCTRECDGSCFPTLSELIEACGDFFFALEHGASFAKWRAQSKTAPAFVERGNTPEEAVARLWLALNRKET